MQPYDALGVPKDASADEIKRAYRTKAQRHHPDKGGDTTTFQIITTAYEVLSDAARRERYDATGRTDPMPSTDVTANSMVADLLLQYIECTDTAHTDIIKKAIDQVRAGMTKIKEQKFKIERGIEKRLDTIGRITHRDGQENRLAGFINASIADLRAQQTSCDEQLVIGTKVIGILQEYAYRQDDMPTASYSSSTTLYGF